MSEDEQPAVATRPASCKADLTSQQFATCERCAIAWDPLQEAQPDCAPITPRKLLGAIERVCSRAEASYDATLAIFRDDPRAANPLPALTLLLELKALTRLLERVLNNREIVALLRKDANG